MLVATRFKNSWGMIGALLSFCLLGLLSLSAKADLTENLAGKALHISLVETAINYDYFNQRCRGVRASTHQSEVNRLLIQKYRLTINNFIKKYIATDARDLQDRLKNALYQQVADMGGCQPAREQGLEKNIKSDYRKLFEKVEVSSWFPLID